MLSTVLSNLPLRHRVVVWVAGLLAFGGAGAWLGFATRVPFQWQAGVLLGVVLGSILVGGFLRILNQPPRARQPRDGSPLFF